MHGQLALQHGRHAFGGGLGAWPDHEDHREHHDRHEQHHGVLDDRHQIARLEAAQIDEVTANPSDNDNHEVQHEADEWHERRHAACHGDIGIGEHLVCNREASLLEILLVVRPDDADAREALARDAIEVVDTSLERAQERNGELHHNRHDNGHDGDGREHGYRKLDALLERHERSPDEHDGRHHGYGHGHQRKALELLDIVGRARDERGGAELADLAQTKRGNTLIDGAAQVATEPHGCACGA